MSEIKNVKDGVLIEFKVKPNSSKFKIEKKEEDIIIYCKSPPENNKANQEIIGELKILVNHQVKMVRGFKSKIKTIVIYNMTKKEFEEMIKWFKH